MDKLQTIFAGKTMEEIKNWFAATALMLADVVSSATISLNDGHGNILGALEKAYENRVEIELTIGK